MHSNAEIETMVLKRTVEEAINIVHRFAVSRNNEVLFAFGSPSPNFVLFRSVLQVSSLITS